MSAGATTTVPADERAVVHALNRLTFGPRPGDMERVKIMGLAAWIEQQLAPAGIDDSGLTARLAHLDTLELDSKTIAIGAQRQAREVIADLEQHAVGSLRQRRRGQRTDRQSP